MTTSDVPGRDRYRRLLRVPRVAAATGALLAVSSVVVQALVLDDLSWPLLGVGIVATVVCVRALWNVVSFGAAAARRLEDLASTLGGRFSWWRGGTGGLEATPFAYGAEHERFAVLDLQVDGVPVEIGHLASQVSERYAAPTGRRHAYVVLGLPVRLPHMILSFGHLSRVLGVRVVPEHWHRSQLLDVGLGRRAHLFVAGGGEHVARRFLTPDLVALLARVGRTYDIEIKGRRMYLIAARSVAAGSRRRWDRQRELLTSLAGALAADALWEPLRHMTRGAGTGEPALRADTTRAIVLVVTAMLVAIVVLSLLALYGAGIIR